MCRANEEEIALPATALRCRICESEYALEAVGSCAHCFGPLDPVYDLEEQRRTVTRERIEAGPPPIWRYVDPLPLAAPAQPPPPPRPAPPPPPPPAAPPLRPRPRSPQPPP